MDLQFPDIYNTTIIQSTFDRNWESLDHYSLMPKDSLVLSTEYLPNSSEEQQLIKMLTACKLTEEQYQIVQINPDQILPWIQLRALTNASKVLLLGILPAQLGIQAMMNLHEVNHFDAVQWMPTFSLAQIASNDALKKHLWVNVFQKVYLSKP